MLKSKLYGDYIEFMFLLYSFLACVIVLVSVNGIFKESCLVASEFLEVVRGVILVYTKNYPNHTYISEIAKGGGVAQFCWVLSFMLLFLFCIALSFLFHSLF